MCRSPLAGCEDSTNTVPPIYDVEMHLSTVKRLNNNKNKRENKTGRGLQQPND